MDFCKSRLDKEGNPSVVASVARWRAAFVTVFVGLLLLKLRVVTIVQPFGDEAFYWQESRHLAWGYSDLPPLTAWLIRLGEDVAGHGLIGMRWPFLLLGSALPWLLVGFARRAFDARIGWQVGLLCLCLPLAGSLGVMAMPDVPLTLAGTLAMFALLRAMDDNRWRDWLLLGIALAACWMSHYRAAMYMLAGLMLLWFTPRGRAQWRRLGFWLALAVMALGLVPLLISNWQQHGAGIKFQLLERNPWRFHADALVQPLEQAATCTPLLYVCLLWAAWQCWWRRHEGRPWDILAPLSLSFIVIYFVAGLFADNERFRAHWPLPGYLPLLAALPAVLGHGSPCLRAWRFITLGGAALALLVQVAGLIYLTQVASPTTAPALGAARVVPTAFVGWRESAAIAKAQLAARPALLVADNFMLAAELNFQFGGQREIYTLNHPINVKYGRARQLAIWGMDEAALRRNHPHAPVLLVVDELAARERDREAWLGSLCARIDKLKPVQRLSLFEGRKRIAFYRGQVAGALRENHPQNCIVWRAYSHTLDP